MIKDRVYNLLERGFKHPTNKGYTSNWGIIWTSQAIALAVLGVVITSGRKMEYPITTIIWLSLAMYVGTFIVLYGSLTFGHMIYKKVKNTETKKTIVILLILAIILIFLLPFFMVYVLGYN